METSNDVMCYCKHWRIQTLVDMAVPLDPKKIVSYYLSLIYNNARWEMTGCGICRVIFYIVTTLSVSITPALFHSRLKTYLHGQQILSTLIDCWYPGLPSRIIRLNRTYHVHWFICSLILSLIFSSVPCGRLSWLHVSF